MKELYSALAKFNQEVDRIAKDASNPMFRNNYATVDQIITEIRPILAKNGLSIIQIPLNLNLESGGEWVGIKTILIHESGQTLESEPFYLKVQPQKTGSGYAITPQSLGSAITYCRRYSITSFMCLSTGQDDDGNASSGHNPKAQNNNQNNNQHNNQNGNQKKDGKPNENQMKRYYVLLKQSELKEEELFSFYNTKTSRNIAKDTMNIDDYDKITKYLQQQIDAKKEKEQ